MAAPSSLDDGHSDSVRHASSITPMLDPEAAVRVALAGRAPVPPAVSGGLDSMSLLAAAAAVVPAAIAAVATFDHGTGSAATRSAAAPAVARVADDLGLRFVGGLGALAGADEATWRDARWRFLLMSRARSEPPASPPPTRATIRWRPSSCGSCATPAPVAWPDSLRRRPMSCARFSTSVGRRWLTTPTRGDWSGWTTRTARSDICATGSDTRAAAAAPARSSRPARRAARGGCRRRHLADAHGRCIHRRAPVVVRRDGGALHVASVGLVRYDADASAVRRPAIAARMGVRLDRRGT